VPDLRGTGPERVAVALPTRAQIEAWSVEHLETAARDWTDAAAAWEHHFTTIHTETLRPGGTVWEGDAADAAADRTWADVVKVRGAADHLHRGASVAREGAGDLVWAKRQAVQAITEAEEAGFTVADDLSVSDPTTTMLMRGWDARQELAREHAAEIASRARALATMDTAVAGKITGALAPLHKVSFVEAAGYRFKTDSKVEPEPGDPLSGGGGADVGRMFDEEPPPRPYTTLPGNDEQDIGHDSLIVSPNVKTVGKVPLQVDPAQIESKFKHATDFGVTDPRGRAGFDEFEKAVRWEVDYPGTIHIEGTYHGNPAILNYDPNSGLCVIQTPDGKFVSGWKLSPEQKSYVVNDGKLGGG
jgi:hypothetical protein